MTNASGKPLSRSVLQALRKLAPEPTPQPPSRLQLLVVLEHMPVPVWRRLRVRNDLSFRQLHDVLQRAMGWENAHMHEFEVGKHSIGEAPRETLFGAPAAARDERRTKLAAALGAVRKFRYWYDFGDDWWHTIKIEALFPFDEGQPDAELVDGAGACPPEDCGGPPGYAELLAIQGQPGHPERADLIEHYGMLDPAAFDLERQRKRLQPRAKSKRTR